ncbi:site-specific integrase [uncultured Bradyrhizobium sp.]|uniref:tyrosine-type recombinase/integrase n=1 Tax=uncultured Bradyrhizobium sp. TaxID=199684 RepID=UPI00261255CA|nr:site-specific integrase [uncultured Bradyrhizobium sp.]
MDNSEAPIIIQERRNADGLDAYIPVILQGEALYDANLDRYFLDLPLNGAQSRHSLRAHGYDVLVWVRFLAEARSKTVWQADVDDVTAYHRARRRSDADFRISASSWNRAVASLDKLYRWAQREGLVERPPFTHRQVWRRSYGGRRAAISARNEAYERAARRSDVRFIDLADYHAFRDVGLRGLTVEGVQRPGARDRNGARNALFADLLVTTGLRLEEASFLLAFEIPALDARAERQRRVELPSALTKGDRGRTILLPRRLLPAFDAYIAVERASAVTKFVSRRGWEVIDRPIFIYRPPPSPTALHRVDGGTIDMEIVSPEERARLVICADDGAPCEAAVIWLTEVGHPVMPNSWEAIFARASRRCTDAGIPLRVSPHQLRHSFAVHMLAMLIQRRINEAAAPAGAMEGYRQLLGDPLQQVQRLLGHSSLATTSIYLDHIATRADTIDAAVEELLALVPEYLQP